MADFLTRLVERAWGQAPAAQPLIEPRYAIKPSRFDVPFFDPLAASEPSEPPRAGLLPALRSPVASSQLPAVGLPVAPNPSPVIEANPETKPILTPSVEPVAEGVRLHRPDSLRPARISFPAEPPSQPQPHQVEAAPKIDSVRRVEFSVAKLAGLDHAASEPPSRAAIQQSTPDRAARASTPAVASQPVVGQGETPHSPIFPTWTAPLPSVAPALSNRRARPEPQQPAPTIKVTIGRIDVRADFDPPAKAAPPPAKPDPKISLEDYLRASTSNGGRR